jgi:hypothetical protein
MLQATDTQTQQFLDTLLSRKEQIVTVKTERLMKTRKGEDAIVKRSEFQCLVGVVYDTIPEVVAKRESGELPAENQGLPWGEWAEFPYVIHHKGEYYVRCTRAHTDFPRTAEFIRNGETITREDAKSACLSSEFREGDDSVIFNIKVSSIRDLK